jgi:hypothetical protein
VKSGFEAKNWKKRFGTTAPALKFTISNYAIFISKVKMAPLSLPFTLRDSLSLLLIWIKIRVFGSESHPCDKMSISNQTLTHHQK